MTERDTIFISHADEDAYFATWLASKLQQLGYKVWVDTKHLHSGNSFLIEFDRLIRKEAVKFLAVISKSYDAKSKTPHTGVNQEISLAATVAKEVTDFIVPLKYDETKFSDFFIAIHESQGIPFDKNWATGLEILADQLKKANVKQTNTEFNSVQFWYDSLKVSTKIYENKQEFYDSNWFPVKLPQKLYLHEIDGFYKNQLNKIPFPYRVASDYILTFMTAESVNKVVGTKQTFELDMADVLGKSDYNVEGAIPIYAMDKHIIFLLNKAVEMHFALNGLIKYQQSNREIFYFPSLNDEKKERINLGIYGKTSRSVVGKHKSSLWREAKYFTWHSALSIEARIFPEPLMKVNHHIIFCERGKPVSNKILQNSLRSELTGNSVQRDHLIPF